MFEFQMAVSALVISHTKNLFLNINAKRTTSDRRETGQKKLPLRERCSLKSLSMLVITRVLTRCLRFKVLMQED